MSDKDRKPEDSKKDTAGIATVEAAEKLGSFLSNVFGSPITTSIGMLQDNLSVARWERQLRLADRVQKITAERKERGKSTSVPPRLAVPIIESASLEEDNYLQDLWAHLLSSAMNDSTSKNVRNAFVDIIKQLEIIDVKILEICYKRSRENRALLIADSLHRSKYENADITKFKVDQHEIFRTLLIPEDEYRMAIDNLIRTRLIASFIEDNKISSEFEGDEQYLETSLHYGYRSVCMTQLGASFVIACTPTCDEENEVNFIKRLRKEREIERDQRISAINEALRIMEEKFGKGVTLNAETET